MPLQILVADTLAGGRMDALSHPALITIFSKLVLSKLSPTRKYPNTESSRCLNYVYKEIPQYVPKGGQRLHGIKSFKKKQKQAKNKAFNWGFCRPTRKYPGKKTAVVYAIVFFHTP